VPTVNEQGFKDFDDLTWIGFFLPAGTPADIVNRLKPGATARSSMPEVKERLSQKADAQAHSPRVRRVHPRGNSSKWAKAVKDSGAKGGLSAAMIDKSSPTLEAALARRARRLDDPRRRVRRAGCSGRVGSTH